MVIYHYLSLSPSLARLFSYTGWGGGELLQGLMMLYLVPIGLGPLHPYQSNKHQQFQCDVKYLKTNKPEKHGKIYF